MWQNLHSGNDKLPCNKQAAALKFALVGIAALLLAACSDDKQSSAEHAQLQSQIQGLQAQQSSQQITLRLAHSLDINHPVHQAMVYMDERLQGYSNGSMSLLIYPSGQLGSERESLELLQIGSLPMTKVSASSLEAFVPQMKVFSVPYLFQSSAHLWNTLNGEVGKELLLSGEDYYFRGLGYYDAGSRSFYTTKSPVQSPDDLKGMKIRVMNSQSAVNMVNTMGGAATPVSWGELYTALQQGVVDGAENNPPSFYLSKHYEVAKYYLLDEHTSIPDVLVFSSRVWSQLSPQQQVWLQQAADDSVGRQRELWQIATQEALDAVKAAGVQVMLADKSAFVAKTQSLKDAYKGTDIGALMQRIDQVSQQAPSMLNDSPEARLNVKEQP